jgi:predicted transcriptional regulator
VKTVARKPVFQYHEPMEVQLTFDQEAKLTRMATEQGRAAETLVQEAVERFLNYDEWFSREVDKGLAPANRGEFVEHDDIRKMIDSRYPA